MRLCLTDQRFRDLRFAILMFKTSMAVTSSDRRAWALSSCHCHAVHCSMDAVSLSSSKSSSARAFSRAALSRFFRIDGTKSTQLSLWLSRSRSSQPTKAKHLLPVIVRKQSVENLRTMGQGHCGCSPRSLVESRPKRL
jgi:hypothetical protein